METLYDMGYKEATIPSVYTVICEELSRIDGILEYLTERYDKIDSKSDFRERVYLSDILAFPTKKRGELNDEILKIGRRIAEIEEDGTSSWCRSFDTGSFEAAARQAQDTTRSSSRESE